MRVAAAAAAAGAAAAGEDGADGSLLERWKSWWLLESPSLSPVDDLSGKAGTQEQGGGEWVGPLHARACRCAWAAGGMHGAQAQVWGVGDGV